MITTGSTCTASRWTSGVWARRLAKRLPPGNMDLADQLCRAATSVALNIAEGCGEFSSSDRLRFYRISRRSATECSAILDFVERLNLASARVLEEGKPLLSRIIAMLTAILRDQHSRPRRPRSPEPSRPARSLIMPAEE